MKTELLMDQGGEIACREHSPYPGSDTWAWDKWEPITPEEHAGFVAELGHPPRCETCEAIERKRKAS